MRTHISQFLVGAGIIYAFFLGASAPARDAQMKDKNQPSAAKAEKLYSESPAAWYEGT